MVPRPPGNVCARRARAAHVQLQHERCPLAVRRLLALASAVPLVELVRGLRLVERKADLQGTAQEGPKGGGRWALAALCVVWRRRWCTWTFLSYEGAGGAGGPFSLSRLPPPDVALISIGREGRGPRGGGRDTWVTGLRGKGPPKKSRCAGTRKGAYRWGARACHVLSAPKGKGQGGARRETDTASHGKRLTLELEKHGDQPFCASWTEKDAGDPKREAGDPKGEAGDPKGEAGDPKGEAGDPKGEAGDPNGKGGDPKGEAGDPNGEGGDP
eukprot:scaffold8603_cov109-Isochrysis_galbana.AAC.5